MTTRTGRCVCGSVKFTADVISDDCSVCHCGTCRRMCGGGPFFGVDTRGVTFESEHTLGRHASSSWAERGFCTRCGTVLFYFLKPASRYSMSAGAFDDQAPFRLASEIFIDEKPDGYTFVGDHPRLTGAEAMAQVEPKPA